MHKKVAERDIVALALATGSTTKEAAEQANVSPTTVQHWRKEPEFAERLDGLLAERWAVVTVKAVAGAEQVMDTMYDLALGKHDNGSVRYRAAAYLLDYARDSMLGRVHRDGEASPVDQALIGRLAQLHHDLERQETSGVLTLVDDKEIPSSGNGFSDVPVLEVPGSGQEETGTT